jgi:hypothetical protein
MAAEATIYRCSAAESGCDESTIKRYAVTDHEGRVTLVDYCDDCAELGRMDWNGETAAIVGPLTDQHCAGCSAAVGEPVDLDNCTSGTHPMPA